MINLSKFYWFQNFFTASLDLKSACLTGSGILYFDTLFVNSIAVSKLMRCPIDTNTGFFPLSAQRRAFKFKIYYSKLEMKFIF